MPSEIWSAILSGWPIDTDSLVKNSGRFAARNYVSYKPINSKVLGVGKPPAVGSIPFGDRSAEWGRF